MKHSVKFRVTFWYTCILTLVLCIALACIFYASGYYSIDNIKSELLDEVGDLTEDITQKLEQYPDGNIPELYAGQNLPSFYDDGIMLSLYDTEGNFINGILPEDFPVQFPFKENTIQEINEKSDYWLLYDYQYTDPGNKIWWIRGINSYGSANKIIHRMMALLALFLPLLILFTAFMGYRMVKKALRPVYTITDTVNEISHTSDLSKRLPRSSAKDEFSRLTDTFNEMLSRLEVSFLAEKQFTSDAAHELRTPVSVILAHCEYCLDELDLSKEIKEELLIIYEKAERMGKLISQLLMMARAENQNYQPESEEIDLQILSESVIEELEKNAAAKGIRLLLKNELENSVITGDLVLLTRMLINLMDNAISYGKNGGFAELSLKNRDGHVCIQVKDNGIGILPEDMDKIWNRFYRADKSRTENGGFGLGLFMVRWIVALHGGTVKAESKYQEGTTFTVLL